MEGFSEMAVCVSLCHTYNRLTMDWFYHCVMWCQDVCVGTFLHKASIVSVNGFSLLFTHYYNFQSKQATIVYCLPPLPYLLIKHSVPMNSPVCVCLCWCVFVLIHFQMLISFSDQGKTMGNTQWALSKWGNLEIMGIIGSASSTIIKQ